jgi:DNA-binding HxlR family transcriptional regulator
MLTGAMIMIEKQLPDLTQCPLAATLNVVGDRWTFLILRSMFHGQHHFEQFQSTLKIARNILAQRLLHLTTHGIVSRQAMAEDRRKVEYLLTEKGVALLPALIALRQWGEAWELDAPVMPRLVEQCTSQPIRPVGIFSYDGRKLTPHDLGWAQSGHIVPLDYFRVAAIA